MLNLENKGIVITSRIRLARNLKNYKFPVNMTEEEANSVIGEISNAVSKYDKGYRLTLNESIQWLHPNFPVFLKLSYVMPQFEHPLAGK
jgi:protein-arginine kinase